MVIEAFMKKHLLSYFSIAAVLLVLITGCSVSGPLVVTDNPSEKMGEASYEVILGIFRPMNVDVSIRRAAFNGDITQIATVDYIVERKLFKTRYRTVVTGK